MKLDEFATLATRLVSLQRPLLEQSPESHPFDQRSIHPDIAAVSGKLFDDGHYSQATFEAFKLLDKKVAAIAAISESGFKLMMKAFDENKALISLTPLANQSDRDEQKGYQFIFSGAVLAIRNPRGHEVSLPDSIDHCLDHLSLASLLLRRLDARISPAKP